MTTNRNFKALMLVTLSLSSLVFSLSSVKADPISLKKAKTLAKPYMVEQFAEPVLVKKAEYTAEVPSRVKHLSKEEIAPYYIFSRGANQGFVIVTGDDALPEVVGVTDSGDFDENNMPPFLSWYLDKCAGLVEAAQRVGAKHTIRPKTVAGRVNIGLLIQDHWSQSWPYNEFCPEMSDGSGKKAVSGCVATAASQVAHYWYKDAQHETQQAIAKYKGGTDSGYTRDWPKGTIINWDLLKNQYQKSDPQEYVDAVATLLAVIGNAAKLNYGSSTGGNIHKCEDVFRNILGIEGGKEHWLSGTPYATWSKMIYDELILGHPMTYAGWKEDMSAGHAVVCDGYMASNDRFHINMGWGGSGDGYYNLALGGEPSWGYNGGEEEVVTGICAIRQNMNVTIEKPVKLYKNAINNVKIIVENNGTLDMKGIYLYGNTTGRTPSSSSNPYSSDEETVIPNDGTPTTIRLTIKPNAAKYYLYVMDAKKNLYATLQVEAEDMESDLLLTDMKVDGSKDMQGDYSVIYSNKATIPVTVRNGASVPYDGTVRADIYCSSDEGKTFNLVGARSAKLTIPANDEAVAEINVASTTASMIRQDSLYYAQLQMETTSGDAIRIEEGKNNVVRFVLKGADLQAELKEDNYLYFSGKWDYNEFLTLARKSANKNAKGYDLTAVQNLGSVGVAPYNPNTLYYISPEQYEEATGNNLITTDGKCKRLRLQAGYDFAPKATFIAQSAEVNINQKANKWNLFTAPCALSLPDGMVAREISGHNTSGISGKTTDVRTLEAGKTYLLITSSANNYNLFGEGAEVVSEVKENADTAVIGTLVAVAAPDKAMLIDEAEQQYFQFANGATVEALRGYFYDASVTKAFRAYSSITLDPKYNTYGELIQTAYDVLSDYGAYVDESVRSEFEKAISDAEQAYSARELAITEVGDAITVLQAAIDAFAGSIDDPYREKDCTSYIANPSFEESTTSAKGWTASPMLNVKIKSITDDNYRGVGAKGKYLAYSYNTVKKTGTDISQEVKGLPAGTYRLRAMLGCEPEGVVTLYANGDSIDVPASKYGQYYLSEAIIDDIDINEGESLNIKVHSDVWYKADDFRLTYTGPSATGISGAEANSQQSTVNGCYDLTGRKVNSQQSTVNGIYIVNGKKILVK